MLKAGLGESLFPMDDLSIIGLSEVIPALFKIFRYWRMLTRIILQEQPDILITIDAPDFYLRLLKRLKKRAPHIPNIHYNAPALWASRPLRAKKMARYVDHILCLFPMDEAYLKPYGIQSTFIGHPLTVSKKLPAQPHTSLDIPKNCTPITLLFGSRTQEIKTLKDPFLDACTILQKDYKNLFLLIPTFDKYKAFLKEKLDAIHIPYIFIDPEAKEAAYAVSKAALAASGTVTLELAKAKLPFVVGYKVSWLTYHIAKHIITTPFVCLVNILAGKKIVDECLQHECNPKTLAIAVKKILQQSLIEKEVLQKKLFMVYETLKPCAAGDNTNDPIHLACEKISAMIESSTQK